MAEPPRYFRSANGRFAVRIPAAVVERMLSACIVTGTVETGGILLGRYSEDHRLAEVTTIANGPSDSVRGRVSFVRGIKGLAAWLRKLWQHYAYYYLGEWHYHPDASPSPSDLDVRTMSEIANSTKYRCPEPILLIIGGNFTRGWSFHIEVTLPDKMRIVLKDVSSAANHGQTLPPVNKNRK